MIVTVTGDPENDAGWLVGVPWLGLNSAVFGLTEENALAQAEVSRTAYIDKLQKLIDHWINYKLESRFVEGQSCNNKPT